MMEYVWVLRGDRVVLNFVLIIRVFEYDDIIYGGKNVSREGNVVYLLRFS